MLTRINKILRNKAFTSTETAAACIAVAVFAGLVSKFFQRQNMQLIEYASQKAAADSGLGAYDEVGFEPSYASKEIDNTSNGTSGLLVDPNSFTKTDDTTDTATGDEYIAGAN